MPKRDTNYKELISWFKHYGGGIGLVIENDTVIDFYITIIDEDQNHYDALALGRPASFVFIDQKANAPEGILIVLNEIYSEQKKKLNFGNYALHIYVYLISIEADFFSVLVKRNTIRNTFVLEPFNDKWFEPNCEPMPSSLNSIVKDELRRVFWILDVDKVFDWDLSFMLKRTRNLGYEYHGYGEVYSEFHRVSTWKVFDKTRNLNLLMSEESQKNIIEKITYHLNIHEDMRSTILDYDLYHLRISSDPDVYRILGEFETTDFY